MIPITKTKQNTTFQKKAKPQTAWKIIKSATHMEAKA